MEEAENLIFVLEQAKRALKENDSDRLSEISNHVIHTASSMQDTDSITITTLIYALSKIVQRKDKLRIKNWNKFVSKFGIYTDLAIVHLKKGEMTEFADDIQEARKTLNLITATNIKPYLEEVLRKASINKGSKIYEHGISLGRTAEILGLTQWELSEYTNQKISQEDLPSRALSAKERAKIALEFLK